MIKGANAARFIDRLLRILADESALLNQLLTVGQVAAGVISGRVALLSDAAHNFNDANALLIAF